MNISDLLGAVVQSGMSPSSSDRLKNSMGGGGMMDALSGMLGSASGQAGGKGMGDLLSGVLGGGKSGGGGIGDMLAGALQRGQSGGPASGSGGLGDLLSGMLGEAGKAVGGNKNLAVGGLGALIGSLLGGGKKSMGGAVGGGLMALLGVLAFNALKGSGQARPQVPLGLLEPQSDEDVRRLESHSELILRAMINAIKADGQIDQDEINRLMGKVEEIGLDDEGRRYLQEQLRQPMETETLAGLARGQAELAAQMYAASLLAIEVDTPAEKSYLEDFAAKLGLDAQVTGRIGQMVGLPPA